MNNIVKSVTCKIREVRRESLHEYTLRMETDIHPPHERSLQPFVPKVGEAPISANSFGGGWMDSTIRSVGKVTDKIFEKWPGDILFLRGAYGKGWPVGQLQGKHMVIIIGSTRLALVKSMLNIFWKQKDFMKNAHLVSRFKNESRIIFKHNLGRWEEEFATIYALDTDHKGGWETGFVTEFVSRIPFKDFGEDCSVVVAGPPPTMEFTGLEASRQGVPEERIWMSFERKMSYAVGKCGHCRIDEMYIYLDGPAFNYTQAKYLVDQERGGEGVNHDIDIKKVRVSYFRQSKMAGEPVLQTCVPGAMIKTRHLKLVQDLYERFGNDTFHLGTGRTFNILGVKYEDIKEVSKYIKSYIHDVDVETCGVDVDVTDHGYPTINARNIMSCIGSAHCIEGNANTYELTRETKRLIFPSHHHIKVTMTGCPSNCVEVNFDDLSIMGINKQVYDIGRYIGYGSYVDACEHHATNVLSLNQDGEIDKGACCCVGYDECSLTCPTGAQTRGDEKLYRVILGERTGKQNPGTDKLLPNQITEGVILGMSANWQRFSAWALNCKSKYLHGGHLVDRVGYREFIKHVFGGMEFSPEAKTMNDIFWAEDERRGNMHMMPLSEHKHTDPQEPTRKRAQGIWDYQQQRGNLSSGGCEYMPYCLSTVSTQGLAAP